MSRSKTVNQCFSCVTYLVNKMSTWRKHSKQQHGPENSTSMLMKFNHVVTTIIESYKTDTVAISKL